MLKSIISFFNDKKLRTKLLLSYILIALLPVVITGFFLVNRTVDTALAHTENIYEINSAQLSSNIKTRLHSFFSLLDSVLNEDVLLKYIEKSYAENVDYHTKYLEYVKIFDSYAFKLPITYNSTVKLSVYTTNTSIIQDKSFIISINDRIKEEKWFKSVFEAEGQNVFIGPYTKPNDPFARKGSQFFTIGKLLNPNSKKNIVNVVRLEVSEGELYKMIEKEGENKFIYIIDNNNTIISSTVLGTTGKNCSEFPVLADVINTQGSKASAKISTDDSIIFYNYINEKNALNGWKIISIYPTKSMRDNISGIIAYSVLICIISIIVAIIFIIIFSKTLTKRLNTLVKSMSTINAGRFDVSVEISGKDEISELSNSFNEMVARINNLINEVYLLDIGKKEAEIHALQSQMNPHFLFNTMESIRMNLWNKQDFETSGIIQKFAKLLRKSIEWDDDKITLKQEIELVETYLQIQKYRYKDKLDYEINIDENLWEYIIPKFTLQPLAENAIYHGIEMKKGKGILSIFSEVSDKRIKIVIQDDGIGMYEDELEALKNQITDPSYQPSKSRIGVKNIHQRLKLYYGESFGINVQSEYNLGTRVEVILPANDN